MVKTVRIQEIITPCAKIVVYLYIVTVELLLCVMNMLQLQTVTQKYLCVFTQHNSDIIPPKGNLNSDGKFLANLHIHQSK